MMVGCILDVDYGLDLVHHWDKQLVRSFASITLGHFYLEIHPYQDNFSTFVISH